MTKTAEEARAERLEAERTRSLANQFRRAQAATELALDGLEPRFRILLLNHLLAEALHDVGAVEQRQREREG